MTETEHLRKDLAEAKAEIATLRLQLDNVTMLYKHMMIEAGKLPKSAKGRGDSILN
jgi:hypothetical protein